MMDSTSLTIGELDNLRDLLERFRNHIAMSRRVMRVIDVTQVLRLVENEIEKNERITSQA